MSRLVYLDCSSGASGDMILGALVDAGVPLEALRAELAKVPLGGYRLESRSVTRCGLASTKVDVVIEPPSGGHDGHHHHPHQRGLTEILHLLEASTLDAAVKERSAQLFRRLAESEATVHGTTPERVHFHEVGAVDSIVDIVGAVAGFRLLAPARFVASPLNLGGGEVTMSHGTFPVPPPATALLVRGVPVFASGEFELLTPTGALLVTSFASSYGALPPMRPEAVGYGAGTRDLVGRPNVLRLIIGEESSVPGEKILVLETALDDMTGELIAPLVDQLLGAGALDVYLSPIHMKKGRPGIMVTVLVEPSRWEAAEEILFAETTTLGVRRQEWDRTVLEREVETVATPHGEVRVKIGRRGGRVYNVQPEFEDCQRLARSRGVPVKEVFAAAVGAWRGKP